MSPTRNHADQGESVLTARNLGTEHAMFTRLNGVSSPPYNSLNLSYGVGDAPNHVHRNRQIIKEFLGIDVLVSAAQRHGTDVFCADEADGDTEIPGYDALITTRPGTGLLIQQADCQAILLHDPVRRAIGAVHCGWRGSVKNIIAGTVRRMRERYGTDPADLQAAISPALGPCCAEFINYKQELPEPFHAMQVRPGFFDFRQISISQLTGTGIPAAQIEIIERCTVCDQRFFSYRRSTKKGKNVTGRQGSVIVLKP